MDWVNDFIIPLALMIFLLVMVGGFMFVVLRAVNKKWKSQWKFILKYTIGRAKMSEETVKWCMGMIDNGKDYFETKKYLMVKSVGMNRVYETMFIFNKVSKQLQGGVNGKKFKGSNTKIERTKLPDV